MELSLALADPYDACCSFEQGQNSWAGAMTDYRVYFIGRNGHIQGFEPLSCADDAAAIAAAKRLVGSHGVEVWQDARRVITLEAAQVAGRTVSG